MELEPSNPPFTFECQIDPPFHWPVSFEETDPKEGIDPDTPMFWVEKADIVEGENGIEVHASLKDISSAFLSTSNPDSNGLMRFFNFCIDDGEAFSYMENSETFNLLSRTNMDGDLLLTRILEYIFEQPVWKTHTPKNIKDSAYKILRKCRENLEISGQSYPNFERQPNRERPLYRRSFRISFDPPREVPITIIPAMRKMRESIGKVFPDFPPPAANDDMETFSVHEVRVTRYQANISVAVVSHGRYRKRRNAGLGGFTAGSGNYYSPYSPDFCRVLA